MSNFIKQIRNKYYLLIYVLLISCTENNNFAPVYESHWFAADKNLKTYVVKYGDTLYAVAFHYDKDYRQLAQINHLTYPYDLSIGQTLSLQNISVSRLQPLQIIKSPNSTSIINKKIATKSVVWQWPCHGIIINNFQPQYGKKGIDIAGKKGDNVRASAAGEVAYAGHGLTGYGNLIIIKHNNYLTAYGNNMLNLVKEGEHIISGQIIAKMGNIDKNHYGVHFEIRKAGIPINPINYLTKN